MAAILAAIVTVLCAGRAPAGDAASDAAPVDPQIIADGIGKDVAYDPDKRRFYVLMNKMPDLIRDALYSHELYHTLQDQYFGLAR